MNQYDLIRQAVLQALSQQAPNAQATAGITPRPSMGGYVPDPSVVAAGVTQALPPPNKPSRSVPAMAPMPGGAVAPAPSPAAPPPGPMPQPLAGTPGAPQSISPLAYGGQLPALPEGGLPAAGQESGGGFMDILGQPEVWRALMNGGMRLMAASAPSTDPRSGSLGFGLSQGLGGAMEGMDDVREEKRQAENDEINRRYKEAGIASMTAPEGVRLQKFYTDDGLEAYGYFDEGQRRMIQVGGAKSASARGGGGRAGAGTPSGPAAAAGGTMSPEAEAARAEMLRIRKMVEDNPDLVGLVHGSGAGQLANQIGSVFDGEDYAKQRELDMFNSETAIELVQKLKGPLSEKELAFLRSTLPKLDDPPEVWLNWIDRQLGSVSMGGGAAPEQGGGSAGPTLQYNATTGMIE